MNRSDGGKVPLVHRLKYALTLVTIEPMVLVQGVADYIAEVPEAQMVLYKTCRGRQCGQMDKQCTLVKKVVKNKVETDLWDTLQLALHFIGPL